MRDGKSLLIASRQFAREIAWKSWWHLGISTAVWLLTLAGIYFLPWQFGLPLSLLAGLLMVRLFVIFHDHMHGAILRRSWLGGTFLRLYGYLTLNPPHRWKHTHDDHHQNNCRTFGAALGSFPVLTVEQYTQSGFWGRLAYRIVRNPLVILSGYLTGFVWNMTLYPLLRAPHRNVPCALALVFHASIYIGLAMLSWKLLCFGWIVPLVIAGALGTYLFYAQHNFPGIKRYAAERWDYVLAALQSSSCLKTNSLMHWFTANIGYHHVHHLNHKIPFYRLVEAMNHIPELQSPVTTSLHPLDIARCLRLKLWDAEEECLVTFRQARRKSRVRAGLRRGDQGEYLTQA